MDLIEHYGFSSLGLELPATACIPLDQFVRYGKGSLDEALSTCDSFDSAETRLLFRWIRERNRGMPESRRIAVFGFNLDLWNIRICEPLDFLATVLPSESKSIRERVDEHLDRTMTGPLRDRAVAKHLPGFVRVLGDLVGFFRSHQAALIQCSTADDWYFAQAGAIEALQSAQYDLLRGHASDAKKARSPGAKSHEGELRKALSFREESMAENILRFTDFRARATGTILWAHNMHVTRSAIGRFLPEQPMGGRLATKIGNRYLPVFYTFGSGRFLLRETADHPLGPESHREVRFLGPIPGSLERTLLGLGCERAAIDMTAVSRQVSHGSRFTSPIWTRSIGRNALQPEAYTLVNPSDACDILVFIRCISPMGSRSDPLVGVRWRDSR